MGEFIDPNPTRNIRSVGPFHRYPVVMNGWTVPNLEAQETRRGVTLTLDHRLSLDLNDTTEPGAVIWFVANAIAVAKGYACHPTKDGWADDDRISPPTNPRWPWIHLVSGDHIEGDE